MLNNTRPWACAAALLLAACSKTPKELSLQGFNDRCNAVKAEAVEQYCDCMMKKLDAEIPARDYNDPNQDQFVLIRAFEATAMKLMPICKAETSGEPLVPAANAGPVASAPPVAATAPTPTTHNGGGRARAEEWAAVQKKLRENPAGYKSDCIEGSVRSEISLGGASDVEANSHRADYEKGCDGQIASLQHCMTLDATTSERCYTDLTPTDSE